MTKTYFVGSNNQVKRIDDHTFSAPNGIQLYPVGTPDTVWRDVMTHPTNPDKVIIVGTSVDVGPDSYINSSIQLSNDGGTTWFTPGGNWSKNCETFHEVWWCEDGQTIWAINSFGRVVRSDDGGLNFDRTGSDIGLNFPGDTSWTSAIHALDELTAVVAGSPSGSIAEYDCYVWLTVDGGTTWNILNSGVSLYNNIINPVTSAPYGAAGASNGIWINDNRQKIVVAAGYGQWLSTDGGISFQAIAVDMHRAGQHLTWFPTYDINPPTYRHVGGPAISVIESLTAGLSWTNERSYEPGTFGIVPPTNQPTPIIGAHFYETEKGYYSVNDQLFSTDNGAVTGTPIDSITNGIIQAVWTGESQPEFPILYTLVDTCENEPFYNDAGVIVVFEYNGICSQLETIDLCPSSLELTTITSFDDGQLYNGAGCYQLTEISEYPTDAFVTQPYEDTFSNTITITTDDTGNCCPTSPCYMLVDCAGQADPIYTGTDLSAHIGEVITLADEDNHEIEGCWQVALSNQECFDVPEVVVYKCYEQCEDCLPAPTPIRTPTNRVVLPNYQTGNCDPELVEKAFCAYSDMLHKTVRERRFKIQQCCPQDEAKVTLQYFKIKSKLLESTSPVPDPCNPLCYAYEATVQPTFSAVTTFVDCFGTEQTIVTPTGTEPQVISFCALNTTTPTITITDSSDNEIGTFPITPIEECLDPVVPTPPISLGCCIEAIFAWNPPNDPPETDINFETSFQIFRENVGLFNGYNTYTALIEGALELNIWYDGAQWYLTESPVGDISISVATLDAQDACPYNSISLPWVPINIEFEGMLGQECQLNYDTANGDFLIQYIDEPLSVAILNKNTPTGTYNGQKYWQFEFLDITIVGSNFAYVPSGDFFEISFDGTWKLYQIVTIGQPAGTGTLAFTTNNSIAIDPSAIPSVERDPNGWANVGGVYIDDYVITSDQ